MDYYLNNDNVYQRLEDEYKKYGKLIIAYDFDDTVYDFHTKGRDYEQVIQLLRRWKNYAELIVFTGNSSDKYAFIEEYLMIHKIPYTSINGDSSVKTNSRKIYYNALLDDRAGLSVIYNCLNKLMNKIQEGEF